MAQADGRFVFGVIVLVKYDQGCFGYKDMDECMGPGEARAPTSLLRKLSPLKDPTEDGDPNTYARQWRARCHAFASIPSYNIGDVITLGKPIALRDGAEVHEVRKSSYFYRGKNRSYYIDVVSGASFRLNRMHLSGSKLKTSAICAGTDVLAEFTARQARGA